MSADELIPYNTLIDSMQSKLKSLGPYQQADCTGEFNDLSGELFGGNIFGENAIAKCGNTSEGPAVYFSDRVLVSSTHHGSYPLLVAALRPDGFHVSQDAVFVDWLSAREVREDGTLAYAGAREAVGNSPFNLDAIDRHALEENVQNLATARVAARTALFFHVTEEQVRARQRTLAGIASKIGDLSDTADIAEVFATENRVVPHVLRSPNRQAAADALKEEGGYNLCCTEDGIWMAVSTVGRLSVRVDTFVPRATYRDRATATAEERFWGLSGPRVVMAVGREFDSGEREALARAGRATDALNQQVMGKSYGTPYEVEAAALPHGVLMKDEHDLHYRVFVAE